MSFSNSKFYIKHQVATGLAAFAPKVDHRNRVLMYHSIFKDSSLTDDVFSVKLKHFKSHMDILKNGFKVIPFPSEDEGVSITFDDGFADNLTLAAPVLLEAGMPFTIFMISDFVSAEHKDYLNLAQLRELAAHPLVTIGSHGKSHRPLGQLSFSEAREELRVSKLELENMTGKPVTAMSYPHGSFTPEIVKAAEELGYLKCGNSIPLPNPVPNTLSQVKRQCIYTCESDLSFKQKIEGQWDWIWKEGRIS